MELYKAVPSSNDFLFLLFVMSGEGPSLRLRRQQYFAGGWSRFPCGFARRYLMESCFQLLLRFSTSHSSVDNFALLAADESTTPPGASASPAWYLVQFCFVRFYLRARCTLSSPTSRTCHRYPLDGHVFSRGEKCVFRFRLGIFNDRAAGVEDHSLVLRRFPFISLMECTACIVHASCCAVPKARVI